MLKLKHQQQQNRQSGKDNWNFAFPRIFDLKSHSNQTFINALNIEELLLEMEKNHFLKITLHWTRYYLTHLKYFFSVRLIL